jgi:uncharacterized membrane protein YeaQ/YmgE (transglycosylase-associated protein family)
MTVLEFLVLLLVADVCGALGQAIAGTIRGGLLVSIAPGFIGALLGMWIARTFQLPELFAVQVGDQPFPIIGSAIFVAVLSLFTRPYKRRDVL